MGRRRITVKAKGKARAMSSLQVQPSAGSSSTALQPKISPNSRIHYYVVDPELDNENKVKRRSRNSGKLAQLMDMPLEVFFEITSKLKPLDLLQLSRVSKHFRETFTAKSSRGLWKAARRNASSMPDPPLCLSEPKYAALVFEHVCFACGVGRSPKVDHALSVRFCGACWKLNVQKGKALLKLHKGVEELILTLLPHEYHSYASIDPKQNGVWNNYYLPEFESVVAHFTSLSADEAPAYIEERRAAVVKMHEHAKAVACWEERTRHEQYVEDQRAQQSRKESIEKKLFDMGYTEQDFPPAWYPEWSSCINQPRALTPRIWKNIEPKLIEAIAHQRARKIEKAREERLQQRRKDLHTLYAAYVDSMPVHMGPLPPYGDLDDMEPVNDMVQEDYIDVTEDRFRAVVPLEVEKYCRKMRVALAKTLRPEPPKTAQPDAYSGRSEDGNSDTDYGYGGAEIGSGEDVVDEDADTELLQRATSLFKCGYCPPSMQKCLSFLELVAHVRERHALSWQHRGFFGTRLPYFPDMRARTEATAVLHMLGLAKDAPYEEVSRRIACTCGKPGFTQPASFSQMIDHIIAEREWFRKVSSNIPLHSDSHEVLHNDHDLEGSELCIKLVPESEPFPTFEQAPVEIDLGDARSVTCRICQAIIHNSWYAGCLYFHNAAEFAHHVRTKHLREPTEADVRF